MPSLAPSRLHQSLSMMALWLPILSFWVIAAYRSIFIDGLKNNDMNRLLGAVFAFSGRLN